MSPPGLSLHPSFRRLQPPKALRAFTPKAVYLLTVVNLTIGLLLYKLGPAASFETIERFGQDRSAVWKGEYWRLLTATFLHAGSPVWLLALHMGSNLLLLILIGRLVERWIGSWRFVAAYLLCGLGGSLLFQADPRSGLEPGVGASGAIYGIVGVFLVGRLGRQGHRGVVVGRRLVYCVAIAALAMWMEGRGAGVFGIQVAVSAHVGGFFCGLLLAYLMFTAPGVAGERRRLATKGFLLLIFVVVGVYGLFVPFLDWAWQLEKAAVAIDEQRDDDALARFQRARELGGDPAALGILDLDFDRGNFAAALAYWESQPLSDPTAHRLAGYRCYDALAAADMTEDAFEILDELIRLVDEELEEKRSPDLLNEAAWYRALRGQNLPLALEFIREADSREPGRSDFVNTLGWVQFRLGDHERGLANLKRAAEMHPIAPFLLYVARAYFENGNKEVARQYAELTRRAPGHELLERHDLKMLERLEASLASG